MFAQVIAQRTMLYKQKRNCNTNSIEKFLLPAVNS